MKERGAEGRERIEKDKYTQNLQGWPPPVVAETTRATLYVRAYVSAYLPAHIHIHAHKLMPAYMHI